MTVRCANCEIQFDWQPTVLNGQTYCCLGCAMGGPCSCDYSNLPHGTECRMIMAITNVCVQVQVCSEEDQGRQQSPEI